MLSNQELISQYLNDKDNKSRLKAAKSKITNNKTEGLYMCSDDEPKIVDLASTFTQTQFDEIIPMIENTSNIILLIKFDKKIKVAIVSSKDED